MKFDMKNKTVEAKIVFYGPALSGKTTTLKYLFQKFGKLDKIKSINSTTGRTLFFDFGILKIKATVNQACCAFSQGTRFYYKFFYYWLLYRRPILISLSEGGGQPNLSQEDLKSIRCAVPDLIEQKAIATFLDTKTAQIDALIDKVETSIEKLKEYRSALITAAVTGKIDVRKEGN